jgi:HKD family nuclease
MKAHLYNQSLAHRFGAELRGLLENPAWLSLHFAVAWVRSSGMRQLSEAMAGLLRRGGSIRGTVGIDIENTSIEGLRDLIALYPEGDAAFYVYHNENPRTVFHPKVYLLQSATDAALVVGSNNLTESGLYTNTEAGLRIDASPNDQIIADADAMLAAWRNDTLTITKRLTPSLVKILVERGYVLSETALRNRRRAALRGKRRGKRVAVFGTVNVSVPPAKRPMSVPTGKQVGAVLLMRVRRASETTRRTQVQIPIRVTRLPFFAGVSEITSNATGDSHRIGKATARGSLNTVKLEVPEIATFADPIMKLEQRKGGVFYTAYDASSPEGTQIMAALRAGVGASPNATTLTRPTQPHKSTWWRFV